MPRMVELEEEVGLAEAIFDNEAEWPDELQFHRGDILHVLDQHPAGGLADGWWLCADKQQRRGIAPANRLKMIHNFGQGRSRVITPRRFGDVFLYNHRIFNNEPTAAGDDFFGQPPGFVSFFNNVYDVPTALKNLYLLHGSDHPFVVNDKIGNSTSTTTTNDNLPIERNAAASNNIVDRSPIVRNVPIRLERRGEADGGTEQTSDDANVVTLKSSSLSVVNGNAAAAANRARSPPPPPPQRRHFNLSGPLLLSSLVTAPTTSSTSSSGSDEERIAALAGTGSGQPSPNSGVVSVVRNIPTSNSTTGAIVRQFESSSFSDSSSSPSVRHLPSSSSSSFYDSPSSLLSASKLSSPSNGTSSTIRLENSLLNASEISNGASPLSTRRSTPGGAGGAAAASQERPRYATILKKDPPPPSLLISGHNEHRERRSPMTVASSITNGGGGGGASSNNLVGRPLNPSSVLSSSSNEANSITMYDVPRSLRDSSSRTRIQGGGHSSNGGATGDEMTDSSIDRNFGGALKSIMHHHPNGGGKKFGPSASMMASGETSDAERLSISSMDSKSSDYQELLSGSSELRLSAAVAMDTLIKLLENLQGAVHRLCAFEIRNWRRKEYLESHIVDIRASCRQSIASLKDFFDFSSGAFVNVNKIVVSNINAASSLPTATGANAVDGRLAKHLAHLVRPLGDSLRLLIKLQQNLDVSGWSAGKFAREGPGNDSLDQFIAVAKQVPQDARQVASFIHGNVSSIFPPSLLNSFNASATSSRILSLNGISPSINRDSSTISSSSSMVSSPPAPPPLPPAPHQQQQQQPQRTVRFAEDVHLSTGEVASINGGGHHGNSNGSSSLLDNNGKSNARAIINGGGSSHIDGIVTNSNGGSADVTDSSMARDMRRSIFDDYDYVGEPPVSATDGGSNGIDAMTNGGNTTDGVSILAPEDRQILQFYSPQVENHIACLSNAIDDFLEAVERNEPPKVFVGHSKFVILGAHKLVYIGDSLAQCIRRKELGEKVKQCADHLCEVLKYCVTATKQAALQYPSVPSIQIMVDSTVNVSHGAYELKLLIQEASSL